MPQIPEYHDLATAADDDLLPVVDVSELNQLKKIRVDRLRGLGIYVESFNARKGAVTFQTSDLTDRGVKSFNGRRNDIVLESADLNGLDGSGLSGVGTGTGGVSNTGSTTIGADTDADGVGVIDLQTRNLSRLQILNDGSIDFKKSPIVNFAGAGDRVYAALYTSLAAAISAIGSARKTLTIATLTDDPSLTFPANITLEFVSGGGLNLTTAPPSTILGPIVAAPVQIFYNALPGESSISFVGNNFLALVFPQWWGARGDNTTDDSNAIQAAVTAAASRITFFPAATYLTTKAITVTANGATLRGAGYYNSLINFSPPIEDICFDVNNGAAGISFVEFSDLALTSANMITKHGIRITSGFDMKFHRVKINQFNSTANDSVGLELRGHEILKYKDLTITADRPILVQSDPNSTYDFDQQHFTDLYLIAHQSRPCIEVESGVNISNVTFDGVQSWIAGKHGFYCNDTATPAAINMNLTIKNVRWEQNIYDDGWLIYFAQNQIFSNLILENLTGGGVHGNGIYVRKVDQATITNVNYQGALCALNADATCTNFEFTNPKWPTATFTLAGFKYYNATVVSGQNFRNIEVADSGNAALLPATGNGALTRGLVIVITGGGSVGMFSVHGPANLVIKIADANNQFTVAAGTAGKTNVYWNGTSARYEIENKQGAAFMYAVYSFLDNVN
jgi:hypothetical protein